jgi:hypothetical protein
VTHLFRVIFIAHGMASAWATVLECFVLLALAGLTLRLYEVSRHRRRALKRRSTDRGEIASPLVMILGVLVLVAYVGLFVWAVS